MTTLREAAKKALATLSAHATLGLKSDKAISALRAALDQPEPVETDWEKLYRLEVKR